MASVFDYIFNVGGNFTAQINGMSAAAGEFSARAQVAESRGRSFAAALATFSYATDMARNLSEAFGGLSGAGISLDAQMHDLSAVAGVTGEGLKQIETFARESAKAFGTDASVAVEGYKLLLSQLSPELGKYPEALREMGDCIQTTSKLMGGDGVAAAEVLTTAMNQYGVSMEDPTAAAGEMARMMNVMAAAGQAGSAELPAISAALQQCGMAAKAANVSFEETNAAIQVLDKAGKKASEGGVALRNVLGQLSKGRFIEKQAAEELAAAGIDVVALADNSKSLKERLEMLKPLLNDSALLSKFFGVENANAARALIQGTDALEGFTEAVTGTQSAEEQAAIVMDSYAERQARVNQKIEDFKISLFQATGDLSIWCSTLSSSLVPLAQLAPIFTAAGKSIGFLSSKLLNCGSASTTFASTASGAFSLFSKSAISSCKSVSVAISSIPIIGWIALLVSLVGYLCVKFEWARYVVGMMIFGIGGVIAAFVRLLYEKFYGVRLVILTFWELLKALWAFLSESIQKLVDNINEGFNSVVQYIASLWERLRNFVISIVQVIRNVITTIKTIFLGLKDFILSVINVIISKISTICAPVADLFKKIASGIKSFFVEIFDWVQDKFVGFINKIIEIYNKVAEKLNLSKIQALGKEAADKSWAADHSTKTSTGTGKGKASGSNISASVTSTLTTPDIIPDPTGGSLSVAAKGSSSGAGESDGGGRIKNITVNIEKLVERFEIHSAAVGESTEQIKTVVLETLMGALNDTQLAIS